jgi:hypothetical protein
MKERTQKHMTAAGKAHITANDERKRYYEMGEAVSMEIGAEPQNPQVTNQIVSSDLNVKNLEPLEQVDNMKRAWQNDQCHPDGQTDATPDLLPERREPNAKRRKLGILPAYIPLG